jgi:hypothetical protein
VNTEKVNLNSSNANRSVNMNKRSALIVWSAAIIVGLAFSATPSFAQKKTVKACQEEWRANKAANEAAKITEKAYVAKCRAESAKPAAATKTTAPKTPAAAPKSTAKKPADGRQAEYARERACAADWKAAKAAGKVPAGMTWPKYWSECDKRKKAQGM